MFQEVICVDLKGQRITHPKFGEGTIIQQKENVISVQFDTLDEIKKFQIPNCLKDNVIKFLDEKLADEIRKEMLDTVCCKTESNTQEEKIISDDSKEVPRDASVIPQFTSVTQFCIDFNEALLEEIELTKKTKNNRQTFYNGVLVKKTIEEEDIKYIYSFESDSELYYPENTDFSLWFGSKRIGAKFIGNEFHTSIVESSEFLGDKIEEIDYSVDNTDLIKELIIRLDEIKNKEHIFMLKNWLPKARRIKIPTAK